MRESGWRITWNPAGATSRVLLDFGDRMDGEIQRDLVQVVDIGRFDQATVGRPFGRKNRKRRLEFNRLVEFSSSAEAFLAMLDAAANDPWGEKQLVQIAPVVGGSIYGRAALLSVERQFVTQPYPGFTEKYAFRIDSGLKLVGSPFTIIGGWFNPPVEGGGTSSGGITIIIDGDDTGLEPGDVVYVDDVGGVTPGLYPVSNVTTSGGQTQATVDAPSNNVPRINGTGVVGASQDGYVDMQFDATVYLDGMGDGAEYKILTPGGEWLPVIPDVYGRKEVTYSDITSRINYGVGGGIYLWAGAVNGDVLPITGGIVDNPSPGDNVVKEDGPSGWTLKLKRNDVEVNSQTITPSWATAKTWQTSGPASHVISGVAVTFTLHGNGLTTRRDTGVSEPISGGTLQKAT